MNKYIEKGVITINQTEQWSYFTTLKRLQKKMKMLSAQDVCFKNLFNKTNESNVQRIMVQKQIFTVVLLKLIWMAFILVSYRFLVFRNVVKSAAILILLSSIWHNAAMFVNVATLLF